MRAVISRRLITGVFELFDADQIGVPRDLARQREHQHQSLLRGGDIGAAANREHFYASRFTCGAIDVASGEAVFLHELERASGAAISLVADGQFFDHDDACAGSVGQQLALDCPPGERRSGKIFCACARMPSHQPRKSGVSCLQKWAKASNRSFGRARVEDDLDETQKTVVFDDEFHRML